MDDSGNKGAQPRITTPLRVSERAINIAVKTVQRAFIQSAAGPVLVAPVQSPSVQTDMLVVGKGTLAAALDTIRLTPTGRSDGLVLQHAGSGNFQITTSDANGTLILGGNIAIDVATAKLLLDGPDGSITASSELGFAENGGSLHAFARGNIVVDVDHDNSGTTNFFVVTRDGGAANIFVVREDGLITAPVSTTQVAIGTDPGGGDMLRVAGTTRLNGNTGIGIVAGTNVALHVNKVLTTSNTLVVGVLADILGDATATGSIRALEGRCRTEATAFTVTACQGLFILDATKGAGSTITTLYGIWVDSQTQGATNYAIFTNLGTVRFGDTCQTVLGTITAVKYNFEGTVTWNASAVQFTGIRLAVTDTASHALSALADLLVGGNSVFTARKTGTIVLQGASPAVIIADATITTDLPIFDGARTWNAGGITFSAMRVVVTDTASASGSLLMDFRVGASVKFKVDKAGTTTLLGELRVAGDVSGLAAHNTITGTSDETANSTGVGTIKFKGATSRDSVGFIKVYVGTNVRWIPCFSAITG